MIIIKHTGDFKNTERFFAKQRKNANLRKILERYGAEGVKALSSATPVDTGLTSNSWSYTIEVTFNGYTINWKNSNVVNGVPIAILLEYGHGTRDGGYVQGRDYINPAMQPLFNKMAEDLWREVTSL